MDNRYYDYKDLEAAALNDPSFENITALVEWLDYYDPKTWNGEEYTLLNGEKIRPVYKEIDEDQFEIVDYELIR